VKIALYWSLEHLLFRSMYPLSLGALALGEGLQRMTDDA